jgi:hypothetical protein
MKKFLSAVSIAAALAFAPAATAQVALDFKVGYALPIGNIEVASPVNETLAMSDWWSGAVPIEVAGRYRFTPNISAGVYFQWNPAFASATACGSAASCSGHDMRVGIELVYDIVPDGAMNPWFSLGTGWQWTQFSATGGGLTQLNVNGWEYLVVQTGLDFVLSKAFGIGPYVGLFGGNYSNISWRNASGDNFRAIDTSARSFHGWVQLGVKGTLNL